MLVCCQWCSYSLVKNFSISLQLVNEYTRVVIFRLGRVISGDARGPGKPSTPNSYPLPPFSLRQFHTECTWKSQHMPCNVVEFCMHYRSSYHVSAVLVAIVGSQHEPVKEAAGCMGAHGEQALPASYMSPSILRTGCMMCITLDSLIGFLSSTGVQYLK